MLNDTDFKQITITFTNKAGEQVTLESPAFFCDKDAMPVLVELENYYVLYGYTMDTHANWDTWDDWVACNIGYGSGIQLIQRRNHSALELYSNCMPLEEQDDTRFFIGGLKKPRCVRPRYNESTKKLKLDLYDEGYFLSGDGYTVLINDVAWDTYDLLAAEWSDSTDDNPHFVIDHDRWDEESLAALLYIVSATKFASMEEFVSKLERGVKWLDDFDVIIDTAEFDCSTYIQNECIQLPRWAYKWLSCYEHSGCCYFEQGDSVHASDRWDTSPLVGVWFLSNDRIKELKKLEEEQGVEARKDAVYRQYKRDMKFISDCNTAYAIDSAWFHKDNPGVQEMGQQEIGCIFWDELTQDNMRGMLRDASMSEKEPTVLSYEITNSERKDPYALIYHTIG